jgi:hypothetical protein
MPGRAHGNQAVHARANGEPRPPGAAIEIDRRIDEVWRERRLDTWERPHRRVGDAERSFVVEALKHFLDDRKARDHAIEIADDPFERDAWTPTKDLDPRARINE